MNIITVTTDIVNQRITFPSDTIIKFEGGVYRKCTLVGNNTTFVAPPYMIFDYMTHLEGTWKVDKVYADNFDITYDDASPAINRAMEFSKLTGCKIELLPKTYKVMYPIYVLGGTTLKGTIFGTSQDGNSKSSKGGTIIEGDLFWEDSPIIDIRCQGNDSEDKIDPYRFSLSNITIRRKTGNGPVISIKSDGTDLTPRRGFLNNISVFSTVGEGIVIEGSSYIKMENIYINRAVNAGIRLGGDKLQEFVWMRQIVTGDIINGAGIEINKGNNIYLTEIDTNDSPTGLLIQNKQAGQGIFNVFVDRFNSARCVNAIKMIADKDWITRVKISNVSIFGGFDTANAIYLGKTGNYQLTECSVDTANIDIQEQSMAINEVGDAATNCHFTNIRTYSGIRLRSCNELTLANVKRSGSATFYDKAKSYLVSIDGFKNVQGYPTAIVNTNQSIPFSVTATKKSDTVLLLVTFKDKPKIPVEISYFLTGYFV